MRTKDDTAHDLLNIEFLANVAIEEHDEYLDWIGGEFDPEEFDLDEFDTALRHVR